MTTDELFAKQKTLTELRQRAENSLVIFGTEITQKKDEFSSLPLETIINLPKDGEQSARLLTRLNALFSHLGGKDAFSVWIHTSIQGPEWKKIWLSKDFQEKTVYNPNDPAWLKEIELEWQRTKSESHLIVGFEPENVVWVGKLILFLRLYSGAIQDELFSVQEDIKKTETEEKKAKELQRSDTTSQPALGSPAENKPTSRSREIEEQARKKQKTSLERNRKLILAELKRRFGLEDQHSRGWEQILELSTLTGRSVDEVFVQYGEKLGLTRLDPKTIQEFKQYSQEVQTLLRSIYLEGAPSSKTLKSGEALVD